ncbi:hypothetical protein [Vibrio parahaemolyticus]|uniref:hypothetical protein n=2 Tax=Vibrio parahaemolyticus TaxID=670 RepID=UPI0004A34C62|nr:hypothetical protein [Vibrio parahaemolyticus]EGR2301930.1 hypothetical protein [Vibrio parahaemolyticus]EHH1259836.1 hypothetical protein [Vibrio parahaemolyticus]EHZ2592533.1 hypothetical protein [Vibrio parahaemolyticus]EIV1707541.1 hypothetical protein [Vibrio parahaemolyticus]EJT0907524.1 hypothetical protein [Vibrio parahaemolyticus]
MTCYETGLAALLNLKLWTSWATIATPIVAIVALIFAYLQLKSSRINSQRSSAYTAYDSYLGLCLEKPKLSYGFNSSSSFNQDEYDQYRWFVSKMLFTFEQILDVNKEDKDWNTTIIAQLKKHKLHLSKSGSVKREEWSEHLTKLINESLS